MTDLTRRRRRAFFSYATFDRRPHRRPRLARPPARLDEHGFVQTPPVLTAAERAELAESFDGGRFRSTIEMRRHRFGEGTYRYFDQPLPGAIAEPAAPSTRRWRRPQTGGPSGSASRPRCPPSLDTFLERCHRAGQERPTPLILRYSEGGHNALHQDVYGDVAFPLQAVTLLSSLGDFAGGQFVLVEGRPRQQSRAHVIDLDPGAFLDLPHPHAPCRARAATTGRRCATASRRCSAASARTLGLIFHDAA